MEKNEINQQNKRKMFIKNYTDLMQKVDPSDASEVIRFCNLFRTNDIDLFNKYKASSKSEDDIINIFAEKDGLDPEKDIKQILNEFLQNAVYEGVSYHITSSANLPEIMQYGLGNSDKRKTSERKDYEKLENMTSPELFKRLEPFHLDYKNDKIFYSNIPNFNARYGEMPEWLMELKQNFQSVDFGENIEARDFVVDILGKYAKKYANSEKILCILPYLGKKIPQQEIEEILETVPPKDIIYQYLGVLKEKNESYVGNVPASKIISINLKTLKLDEKENNELNKENVSKIANQNAVALEMENVNDVMKELEAGEVQTDKTDVER